MERQDVPPEIRWECPACQEAGVISGWHGSLDDLSAPTQSDEGSGPISVVVPDKTYRLLLDELALDPECERVLYGARSHPDGVELIGNEDDFGELLGVVASEANHAGTRERQRRWDDIYACLDPGRRSWLEQSTDVIIGELAGFDLVAYRAHITELIRDKIAIVAKELSISEDAARQYLKEEDLRHLGREVAVMLADEQPGADLSAQARTIPVPRQTIGRYLAALAEAAHVRVDNADPVGAHGALQVISLFGQLLHELPGEVAGPVFLPQAALTRSARLLEATGQMIRDGAVVSADIPADAVDALAEAFARDARTLRALVREYGTSAGPTPAS